MFTGIIEQTGTVVSNDVADGVSRLVIAADFTQISAGESIAVNGVCLTVLPNKGSHLSFDISRETISVSTLGNLKVGDVVNLERAMLATARFGGHYVSGHVDATAKVGSIQILDEFTEMTLVEFPVESEWYLLPKGSITVEGVSLTINVVKNKTVTLMLVPHTLSNTTLGLVKVGQSVNIEFDYLTRIIAHQVRLIGKVNNEVAL
ncbi:MAG: riboflavin synthase [Legionella sp.]|jgi:riboflavin synthase